MCMHADPSVSSVKIVIQNDTVWYELFITPSQSLTSKYPNIPFNLKPLYLRGPLKIFYRTPRIGTRRITSTYLTSSSVSLVNSRMSAAVPTKISSSWDSCSFVTPSPRGRSHFPKMRRMSRIWWRARIQLFGQNTSLTFWRRKGGEETHGFELKRISVTLWSL